jgi:hypothetical protein
MADDKKKKKKLVISIPQGIDVVIEHREDVDVVGQENTMTFSQDKATGDMRVDGCCNTIC